jgi:hypothetical protein
MGSLAFGPPAAEYSCRSSELRAKQRATTVEPRHHRSDRNRPRVGSFFVRQFLHIAKNDDFLKRKRIRLNAARRSSSVKTLEASDLRDEMADLKAGFGMRLVRS